jgi:hypothetical protein
MDYELDNVFNIIIFILVLIIGFSYLSYNNKPIMESFTNNSSFIETGTGSSRIVKRKFIKNNSIENLDSVVVNFKLKENKYLSVFKHKGIQGYKPMGYCVHVTSKPINTDKNTFQQIMNNNQSLHILTGHNISPTEYETIWHSGKMCEYKGQVFSIHKPIHPETKYISLGHIIVQGLLPPSKNNSPISLIPVEDLAELDYHNGKLWQFNMKGVCPDEIHENPEDNPNPNNIICNSVSGHNFFKCNTLAPFEEKYHTVKNELLPNQSLENLVVTLKVKNI